jgi:hypothetical protein
MEQYSEFVNNLETKSYVAFLFMIGVLIISATAIIRDFIKMIFKLILHYGPRKKS